MFANFIPSEAENLTESTSIALAEKIDRESISTPLSPQPIATTYIRAGSGATPILLLHGFDSSVLEFRRLFPLLAAKNQTWAVDLFGFGFTDRPVGLSFGAEAIKTHLYYFWKTLIQEPVILVGASMGGAVAIDFTVSYGESVKKLVILDSAGLAKPPVAAQLMFPPLDYLATTFLRFPSVRQSIARTAYYDRSLASPDAQLCAALHLKCPGWSRALISFTKSGGYGNFAPKLKQVNHPTLILWGRDDKVLGIKDAEGFKDAIALSKLVWIEKCGHLPHLEKPEITAKEILEYCASA
ncbi:MAG: alpha/beta hydrolase [Prochloraceae cyanobacterium]|nr:alpha/beta hydrolase [Prochloraceae cyanobacterium]